MTLMTYQVLARKLRPSTFSELVGQDHVVRALCHGLDHDRLHHAYLFTGTRGVGKTTIGRILAKSLNCEKGVSSDPCGECSICIEVSENRFIDLIEVDAASRTRVDDTRELLENAQYMPTRGRYKVYLIDEVHMLSASSFNALLKTLEEPPDHVKFLLATTDPKKLPVTVLSRCLQFQLRNINSETVLSYLDEILRKEKIDFERGAIELIARASQGSMRDALSITDQAISYGQGGLIEKDLVEMLGLVGRDKVEVLLREIAGGNLEKLLDITSELAQQGTDFVSLLGDIVSAFHNLAVDSALGKKTSIELGDEVIQLLYQIALMGYRDMSIVPDSRSGFEMTLLRMIAFKPGGSEVKIPPLNSEGQISDKPIGQDNLKKSPIETVTSLSSQGSALMESGLSWEEVLDRMSLSGVSLMIAENSILQKHTSDMVELVLDPAHDTLLNDAQKARLEEALCSFLGENVKLNIVVGDITVETIANKRQKDERKRQENAEQSLKKDPAVQSLLETFDGVLDGVTPSPKGD